MSFATWLKRRALRRREQSAHDETVAALSRELRTPPESRDLAKLVPLVVPRAFSEVGNWPGPIFHLAAEGFDQTWAVLGEGDKIFYVDREMQRFWENLGIDWRQRASANIRSLADREPGNGAMERPDRSPFLISMLYGQLLGPARLSVPGRLREFFPEGYQVAVPEVSCAVAFTANPSAEEQRRIDDLIFGCFENGTEPVSSDRFSPELFWKIVSEDVGGGP